MQIAVNFKVAPASIVALARERVLCNDWRDGLHMLVAGLSNMSLDLATEILKGELSLTGSETGVELCPQNKTEKSYQFFIQTFAWQNAGIYQDSRGEFFQPYAYIQEFGPEDEAYAIEVHATYPNDVLSPKEYRELRAKFYKNWRESDLVFFDLASKTVLFKRVQGPAFWVETFKEPKAALAHYESLRTLSSTGAFYAADSEVPAAQKPDNWQFYESAVCNGFVYADAVTDKYLSKKTLEVLALLEKSTSASAEAQDKELTAPPPPQGSSEKKQIFFKAGPHDSEVAKAKLALAVVSLRQRILDQAEQVGGFFDLLVTEEGEPDSYVKVPAAPFLSWATREAGDAARSSLLRWRPVSSSGLKSGGDNPNHTDWWIGAGLDPRIAYDMNHPVNKAAWRFSLGLAHKRGHDCIKLAGAGTAFGRVVHPKPNEAVPAGSIAVVPSAGVMYDIAMRTACKDGRGAVICAVGGKLAHLATVAREFDAKLVVVENALEQFKEGDFVSINMTTCKVTRHATFLETSNPDDEQI